MIKLNSIRTFFTVLALGAIVTGCEGMGGGTSSTGADINVTGDGNLICVNEGTAADDVEPQSNGCNITPPPATSPEDDTGTSQQEGEIPE